MEMRKGQNLFSMNMGSRVDRNTAEPCAGSVGRVNGAACFARRISFRNNLRPTNVSKQRLKHHKQMDARVETFEISVTKAEGGPAELVLGGDDKHCYRIELTSSSYIQMHVLQKEFSARL